MDELMHEAYFGLIKAVESYDSSQGVLFMSYATSWIRQAVKRFLNNCGSVVRVPVHTQERVYRYNQVTSYYLSKYNRMPTVSEYGKWLGVSEKVIKQLQLFMFRDKVKSLDAAVPGEENDDMTVADTVASDINIENDIVEKVGNEQLHTQLEIAIKFKVSKANIDQFIRLSLSRLRTNSKTKRLGAELGFWESKKTVDIDRLRKWAERGYTKFLIEEEIEYAIRMGWLVKGEYY
ncbi:MAG: rpoD [Anaerocolumna sp.]|nr:rpoD [Anaerocolumna sp.]